MVRQETDDRRRAVRPARRGHRFAWLFRRASAPVVERGVTAPQPDTEVVPAPPGLGLPPAIRLPRQRVSPEQQPVSDSVTEVRSA
jgi:hypothetical protein